MQAKGFYYYGARYYDPRTSIWLSVDALATYNPFEQENFIEGQHNGGVYNFSEDRRKTKEGNI